MSHNAGLFIFFSILSIVWSGAAQACESCSCSLSRAGSDPLYLSDRVFFDFTQEGVNWNTRPAEEAHTLHHQGHNAHNKTHEEFYHFSLGFNPVPEITLLAELPYVVRSSTEVDSHATLGKKEVSEGLGDAKVSGVWRFWRSDSDFIGALAGVKLPTGETKEVNSQNALFEPELQPGSGSTDFSLGGVFQWDPGAVLVHGNAVYVFRTQGERGFKQGDLFSTYVSFDRVLNPETRDGKVTLGADLNWQVEAKQKATEDEDSEQEKVADSGGNTVLMGPSLKIQINDRTALLGNFLLPVYQNVGGVHQKIDYIWNASAKITW